MGEAQGIFLSDYQPPRYKITTTELTFDLYETHTLVTNRMQIELGDGEEGPLVLDGDALELICIKVDEEKLPEEAYARSETALTILAPGKSATVQVVTRIYPERNTELEGLYRSGGIYCTQCEPHGFRRITYFIDRPDNMSVFTTKVIADKASYPVLLGNGNLEAQGDFPDGRHLAQWHDPFPKPSYLFALVAGVLGRVHDTYTTAEGNLVELNIYVDQGNEHRALHAMRSLKAAMQWDEQQYGRCYDLGIYNIVAVDSFNMGAMENKGLNIFNSHYVLADEKTATDADFIGIESVIAHEYFHNWTGNRITCRDWFQLTLKEGLTVFRDQSFSADMHSQVVQRIRDVKMLRERQFPEDAGPTAHPIKPDHYIEINNFYTATVYEKGAEVIRMMHTILGEEAWRKAMDLYFETFDGQAVRTEDFLWAVQQHSPINLTQFARWYSQERTPTLFVEHVYDPQRHQLTLTIEQRLPNAVDGKEQLPYCLPLRIALLAQGGESIALKLVQTDQPLLGRGIVLVHEAAENFVFEAVDTEPTLSLNRHFSAPVILDYPQQDVVRLMRFDDDGFNRYEAAQRFAMTAMWSLVRGEAVSVQFLEGFGQMLADDTLDLQFKAQLLELPTVTMLMQQQDPIEVAPLVKAHETLCGAIGRTFEAPMLTLYAQLHHPQNDGLDAQSIGERALKNRLLNYLTVSETTQGIEAALRQYHESLTMTDRIAALTLLENHAPDTAAPVLHDFYQRYSSDILVMTKYFAIIASSPREGTLERVIVHLDDPAFDIVVPNLVRALIGAFTRNLKHFHAEDGRGYTFIAETIIKLDAINPMIAAGLAGAFKTYNRMNVLSQSQMRSALEPVSTHPGLSKNVYEIMQKVLAK